MFVSPNFLYAYFRINDITAARYYIVIPNQANVIVIMVHLVHGPSNQPFAELVTLGFSLPQDSKLNRKNVKIRLANVI